MSKQTVMIPSSQGDIEATKAGQGEPWHIAHPWGDERFYGSKTELKKRCEKIKSRNADDLEG